MSVANYKQAGWERQDADWYVEPPWAVERLLRHTAIAAPLRDCAGIWDPACGQGTIPTVARAARHQAIGSDLHERGFPGAARLDFVNRLAFDPLPVGDPRAWAIVSNPPFALAEIFLERAMALEVRLICFLLRLAFLEGRERHASIYARTPPAHVLVLVDRASMPPGRLLAEGKVKAAGGFMAFAWFCWRRGPANDYAGEGRLGWLA